MGTQIGYESVYVTGYFDDIYPALILRAVEGELLFAGQSTPLENVDAPAVAALLSESLDLTVELGPVLDVYDNEYGRMNTHSLRFHQGMNDYQVAPGESQVIQIEGRNFVLAVGPVITWEESLVTDNYAWLEWVLIAQPDPPR